MHKATPEPQCDRARRRVLGASGAAAFGLLVGFEWRAAARAGGLELPPSDAWIHILPDGRVVLLVAKAEIGQGVLTALPMLLAEELDVDWERVEVRQAPIDPSRYDHLTVGSNSVQSSWLPLRRAAAQARGRLVRAAAARWRIAPEACATAHGRVVGPSGQSAGYAELAGEAAALTATATAPPLKSAQHYRIIGQPHRRIDAADKVSGAALYGIDVRLPGMLHAVIVRCPSLGGSLGTFSPDAALAVAGVKAVFPVAAQGRDAFTRGGIAIVARDSWAAQLGRRRLSVSWEHNGAAQTSSGALRAALLANVGTDGVVVAERGDAPAVLKRATQVVTATFELPFLAHATLEPMNATVAVRPTGVEAWLPTQNAEAARAAIARVLNRPVSSVTVHQTLVGGGFGRRDATDFAVEAAQVAATLEVPVQLLWSREDDLQFGRYRPMAAHQLRATLDVHGRPRAWLHRMSSASIAAFLEPPEKAKPAETEVGGARDLPYDVAAFRMEYTPLRCAVPVGWWRSVEDSLNAFAVECFIDELAVAARQDPLSYRLALLPRGRRIATRDGTDIETDRLRRVLRAVAKLCGWPVRAPDGRARGLACHSCRGSYIAIIAEVSARLNQVRVHRIWAAVDCGTVINPLGLQAQIEGGLQFGTSAALDESITVEGGVVQQVNFDSYPLLRLEASPSTAVSIVPSAAAPSGAGEIAVPPVAPAIANALFALTGQRRRRLPFAAGTTSAGS